MGNNNRGELEMNKSKVYFSNLRTNSNMTLLQKLDRKQGFITQKKTTKTKYITAKDIYQTS